MPLYTSARARPPSDGSLHRPPRPSCDDALELAVRIAGAVAEVRDRGATRAGGAKGHRRGRNHFPALIPIIIGIPLHDIMQGIPMAIMAFMALHRSAIVPMPEPSMGVILQTMPSFVISKLM